MALLCIPCLLYVSWPFFGSPRAAAKSMGKSCSPESFCLYFREVVAHGVQIYCHLVFSCNLRDLREMVDLCLLGFGLDFSDR